MQGIGIRVLGVDHGGIDAEPSEEGPENYFEPVRLSGKGVEELGLGGLDLDDEVKLTLTLKVAEVSRRKKGAPMAGETPHHEALVFDVVNVKKGKSNGKSAKDPDGDGDDDTTDDLKKNPDAKEDFEEKNIGMRVSGRALSKREALGEY